MSASKRVSPGSWFAASGLAMAFGAAAATWSGAALCAPLGESLTGVARADYEAGRILYADGDYSGAALKWEVAYKSSNDARLLWNIAAARKAERKYAEVERLVRQYLAEGRDLSESDRAEAQQLLGTIQSFVADLVVQVNEAGAQVIVDGVSAGQTPLPSPLRVDIGQHVIAVAKQGFERAELRQQVTGNTTVPVHLVPEVHEGRLRIISPADANVTVDGKRVTSGTWEGVLPSGIHRIEVKAPGKLPYSTDTQIEDDQNEVLRVALQDVDPLAGGSRPPDLERKTESSSGWVWVTLGVLALAGAGVGAYYYLQPKDSKPAPAQEGSLDTVFLRTSF